MSAFFLLLLLYALLFVIVVWPIHWIWHMRTQDGEYDKRFYRQPSYWKLYFWIFGTAMLHTFGLNIVRALRG